jgi:hypothetical protein
MEATNGWKIGITQTHTGIRVMFALSCFSFTCFRMNQIVHQIIIETSNVSVRLPTAGPLTPSEDYQPPVKVELHVQCYTCDMNPKKS